MFQGDFGLAKPDMDVNNRAYSFCGSPEYMAPEMLLKIGHTYTVDFYCLGALLYELVINADQISFDVYDVIIIILATQSERIYLLNCLVVLFLF